jgi:hypothetical protein
MAYKGIAISLAALTAACGSVTPFDDAGTGDDVDADTTVDAATEGTINVTTMTRCCTDIPGQPEPGVRVVVTNPDGTPGDSGVTSSAGEIELDVTVGASVTAIYENPSGNGANQLITYTDIEPGDSFTFGEQFEATSTELGTMNVSLPSLANVDHYRVHYPCGTSYIYPPDLSTVITERASCHVAPMDLLFVAYDSNYDPIRWGLLPDVPFSPGGSTSLNVWQNMTQINLALTSLPEDVSQASLQAAATFNNDTTFSTGIEGVPTNGMLSGSAPWASGGDRIQLVAQYAGPGIGFQQSLSQVAGTETNVTIDDPVLLPWLGNVIASPLARQVTWIQDGEGGGDSTVLFLRWPQLLDVWGGSSSHQWIIISPVGGTVRVIPDLGPDGAEYMPPVESNVSVNGGIVDLSADESYDTYRARPEWEATLEDESVIATGSATISIFGFAN